MANGRFISRTIAADKRLSQLTLEAEYLFLKTLPHLDRDGLILADVLWATVAPRRINLAGIACDLWQEWVSVGLAAAYETDEGTVLYFPGFAKNQQGMRYDREAPSRYEPPPGMLRTVAGLTPALTPDQLRTDSGPTPPQVKGQVEGQGQVQVEVEVQGQGETPAASEPSVPTIIATAFVGVGILSASHLDIYQAWPDIMPEDVAAWDAYCKRINLNRRNGNRLEPSFIVSELRQRHRAPDEYYELAAEDEYRQPARVLE